jgi:hypothetical protein
MVVEALSALYDSWLLYKIMMLHHAWWSYLIILALTSYLEAF